MSLLQKKCYINNIIISEAIGKLRSSFMTIFDEEDIKKIKKVLTMELFIFDYNSPTENSSIECKIRVKTDEIIGLVEILSNQELCELKKLLPEFENELEKSGNKIDQITNIRDISVYLNFSFYLALINITKITGEKETYAIPDDNPSFVNWLKRPNDDKIRLRDFLDKQYGN